MIKKKKSATDSSTLRSDRDNVIIFHVVAISHQLFVIGMFSYVLLFIFVLNILQFVAEPKRNSAHFVKFLRKSKN